MASPDLPTTITVDLKQQRLLVDGTQFPFLIAEEPKAETITPGGDLPSVLVRIYAREVEVIPGCVDCARLDALGVDYNVISGLGGQHVRHDVDLARALQEVRDAETRLENARDMLATVQRVRLEKAQGNGSDAADSH